MRKCFRQRALNVAEVINASRKLVSKSEEMDKHDSISSRNWALEPFAQTLAIGFCLHAEATTGSRTPEARKVPGSASALDDASPAYIPVARVCSRSLPMTHALLRNLGLRTRAQLSPDLYSTDSASAVCEVVGAFFCRSPGPGVPCHLRTKLCPPPLPQCAAPRVYSVPPRHLNKGSFDGPAWSLRCERMRRCP